MQILPLLAGQSAYPHRLDHHTPNGRTNVTAHPIAPTTNPANQCGQSTSAPMRISMRERHWPPGVEPMLGRGKECG